MLAKSRGRPTKHLQSPEPVLEGQNIRRRHKVRKESGCSRSAHETQYVPKNILKHNHPMKCSGKKEGSWRSNKVGTQFIFTINTTAVHRKISSGLLRPLPNLLHF